MAASVSALLVIHFLFCLYGSLKAYTGNFDTGTVALMAVNIAHGTDYPLFWYGQHYFGALESYVAAGMMRLFGFSELSLSLSPIFFSQLWILGTYFLYKELAGKKAGLIAATVAAFSGYFQFYYDFSLTGGYAAILALGTWILWSGVRVYTRPPAPAQLWGQVLFTSLLASIGIWVHYLILPSLLVAAVYFFLHWVRSKFSLYILVSYVAGCCVAILGFLPGHIASKGYPRGPSMITSFSFSLDQLSRSMDVLFGSNFHQLFFWNFDRVLPFSMKGVYLAVLVLLGIMMFFACIEVSSRKHGRAIIISAPLLFLVFFFLMYTPHVMSTIPGSPRYVLQPWSIIICTVWSYGLLYFLRKGHWEKIIGYSLFGIWLTYQVTGSVLFVRSMAADKQQRLVRAEEIISFARKHNLQSLQLVGTNLFGYEGQVLSMLAENTIKFVHPGFERYAKNGQAVETDRQYGILCEPFNRAAVAESLRLLDVHYREIPLGGLFCFYDFQVSAHSGRALRTEKWEIAIKGQAKGRGEYLQDAVASTVVAWREKKEGSVVIDLGDVHQLNRIWLKASHVNKEGEFAGLPKRFSMEIAGSNGEFHPVLRAKNHIPVSYLNGKKVYLSGYFGLFEGFFPAESSRYVRILFPAGQRIRLSEILLFESTPEGKRMTARDEFVALDKILKQENIDLVYSDRWLSAKLLQSMNRAHPLVALPRHTYKSQADDSPSRVIIPRNGMVLAPSVEVAEYCKKILVNRFGPGVIKKYQVIGRYGLLFLNDMKRDVFHPSYLYWDGHTLVVLAWYNDLVPLKLTGSGLPAIKPVECKNKGFYYDSWTKGKGILKDLHWQVPGQVRNLVLFLSGPPMAVGDTLADHVSVQVNGQAVRFLHRKQDAWFFSLPEGISVIEEIAIKSPTFTAGPPDKRKLGLCIPVFLVE